VVPVAVILLTDAALAGALFVAFSVDRIGRQGFNSPGMNAAEVRDLLVILACWGAAMLTITVAGLVHRRPEIAVLQAAVTVAVLISFGPTVTRGWHEAHPARPGPAPSPVAPYCPHGNCPGG
jgi:hypothetical protein